MLGALIGDIVGSRFEFNNIKTKDFILFTNECTFTDDSLMTLAVAKVLMDKVYNDKNKIIDYFKYYGRKYNVGYGASFFRWLHSDRRDGYNSFGNGAAMRISPVAYVANSEEEVIELSKKITEVTHNHLEGIKGTEVIAMSIYYARLGKSKNDIKEYASKYYNLDFNYLELVKNYSFDVTCQGTVPQAIYVFLISNDFEDCLRTAISIGGDSDTLACIACSIAEAYYGIDNSLINKALTYFPKELLDIINEFIDKGYYNK